MGPRRNTLVPVHGTLPAAGRHRFDISKSTEPPATGSEAAAARQLGDVELRAQEEMRPRARRFSHARGIETEARTLGSSDEGNPMQMSPRPESTRRGRTPQSFAIIVNQDVSPRRSRQLGDVGGDAPGLVAGIIYSDLLPNALPVFGFTKWSLWHNGQVTPS